MTREMTVVQRPDIPVVIIGRFVDQPLSDQQIRDILDIARPLTPEGSRVWFIGAKVNQPRDDGPSAVVSVYFTPDRQTGRIRHGDYFTIDPAWEQFRAQQFEVISGGRRRSPVRRKLHAYCQVSRTSAPFNDALEIPSGALLPFPAPEDITDAELIDVIDVAFASPAPQKAVDDVWIEDPIDVDAPIAFLRKTDNGYEVRTGTLEGPLSGAGRLIVIEKTNEGLKLKSNGRWVS